MTWYSGQEMPAPEHGGRTEFGAVRSRRGIFFDRASVLWYLHKPLNFFTFTILKQKEDDQFYSSRFSMLLDNYRVRFRRGHPDGFENYVWVAEVQKRGAIHFHLLAPSYVPIRSLNAYWCDLVGQHSGGMVDVEHVPDQIRSIPAYLCKYFTKQWYVNKKTGEIKPLRTLQCRSFGTTRALKLNPVTLDEPLANPIGMKVFKIQSNGAPVIAPDGLPLEVTIRYYNTNEILDTFFADQLH
jgi:hypothetical protein